MNEFQDPRTGRLTTADVASQPASSTAEVKDATHHEAHPRESDGMAALFPDDELERLKSHWMAIQTEFVDEPRRSVEEADGLVASTIKRLAESFAEARTGLERQWARGGDVSTEELRVMLRRYRSFFDRLLAV